jgi:hypothetical protein
LDAIFRIPAGRSREPRQAAEDMTEFEASCTGCSLAVSSALVSLLHTAIVLVGA